jgi:hypothetical protein
MVFYFHSIYCRHIVYVYDPYRIFPSIPDSEVLKFFSTIDVRMTEFELTTSTC